MPTREIHGVSADTDAAHADAAHPAIARVKALIAQGITASGYARAAAVAGGPFKPSFGLSGAVDQARPRGQRIGRSGDSILPFWRTAPGGVERRHLTDNQLGSGSSSESSSSRCTGW